jgi:hypothetical protein
MDEERGTATPEGASQANVAALQGVYEEWAKGALRRRHGVGLVG